MTVKEIKNAIAFSRKDGKVRSLLGKDGSVRSHKSRKLECDRFFQTRWRCAIAKQPALAQRV
ncbi:hypothetical protein [Floridanema evergladense]|uniref:Uncharacterized protein n=1 Tax=Floridaenema evergladense BLCC-F167 TaxID=3153639 RepID=A0ABV4WGW8_9CYAN